MATTAKARLLGRSLTQPWSLVAGPSHLAGCCRAWLAQQLRVPTSTSGNPALEAAACLRMAEPIRESSTLARGRRPSEALLEYWIQRQRCHARVMSSSPGKDSAQPTSSRTASLDGKDFGHLAREQAGSTPLEEPHTRNLPPELHAQKQTLLLDHSQSCGGDQLVFRRDPT